MQALTLSGGVIAAIGVVLCLLGLSRLFKKRWVSAGLVETTGLAILLFGAALLLLAANLHSYKRLVYEQAVAEISFTRLGSKTFVADLHVIESGERNRYEMLGDEWQLDAQVLSWRGFATVLGLDTQYRLHRLSGRYANIAEEREALRSVHELDTVQPVDMWPMINKYQRWVKWIDATYGSAVFLPMTDRAKYSISISRTGLIARPANAEARETVTRWLGL